MKSRFSFKLSIIVDELWLRRPAFPINKQEKIRVTQTYPGQSFNVMEALTRVTGYLLVKKLYLFRHTTSREDELCVSASICLPIYDL